MQWLVRGGYNVLPLGEALTRLGSNSLPKKAVALTFDDGYADFALQAYPVLQRLRFPATVYLTTYYVRFNRPIFNLIVPYMLWRCRDNAHAANPRIGWMHEPELASAQGRARAWEAVRDLAESRALSGAAKDDLAGEVAAHLGLDYAAIRGERVLTLMNAEEAAEVSRGGIDIQLHTHRHRTPQDPSLFRQEVQENWRHVREITGREPAHFCYPSGLHTPEMLPVLKQCGIRSATTCELQLCSASTVPLLLPRFLDMQSVPHTTFDSWLAGTGAMLTGLRPG